VSEDNAYKTITLAPSGKSFPALPNASLLESGLAAGLALPFGCANGSCGDCRATVLSGNVEKWRFHDFVPSESEKLSGVCLLCSYAALSDLTIEVSEATSVEDIPQQYLHGKLCHFEMLSNLAISRFKLSRGKALRFLPGQYAKLTTPDNQSHVLPIASCPCESNILEFHIETSQFNLAQHPLGRNDRVRIEGPIGKFTLQSDADIRSKLLIATGTGFATLKPLIEQIISNEQDEPVTLIWVATEQIDHYRHNLCRSWADAFDWLDYHNLPIISELNTVLHSLEGDQSVYLSASPQDSDQIISLLQQEPVSIESITIDDTNH